MSRPHRLMLSTAVFFFAIRICGLPASFLDPMGRTAYLVNDDSMISLRVARHIAQHMGPYFNQGEHVAASTSLVWPYLMAPVFLIVHDPGRCVLLLALLSAILASFTVAIATFSATRPLVAYGVAATLLALPSLSYYGSSAWEEVPQMLFITLASLALLGRIPWLGRYSSEASLALTAAAFLLRPDTLPILLVLALGLIVSLRHRSSWVSFLALGFTVAAVGAYYALHHHFYGAFVPNTYYLKVHFGVHSILQGLRYLAVSAIDSGIPVLLLAGSILRLRARGFSRLSSGERILIVAMAVQCMYVVLVGGDIFPYGRFLFLFAPAAALLFWEAASDLLSRPTRTGYVDAAIVGLTLASLLAANLVVLVRTSRQQRRAYNASTVSAPENDLVDQALLATCLRSHISPADGQIGIFTLGSLPFYLDEYSFADFLGKADSVIAHEQPKWGPTGHNKWDLRHSLQDRHVSAVPFQMLPDSVARDMVQQHAPAQVRAVLQLDPYMLSNFTYRSPAQLGLPGPYGLLIRNDLVQNFSQPCSASVTPAG